MMNFILNNIKENPVAWYGAIIATLSIIINVLNYLRDRPKIRLEFQKNRGIFTVSKNPNNPFETILSFSEDKDAITSLLPYKLDKTYFVVSVINRGRRPVKIVNAGVKVFHGNDMIFSDIFTIPGERILTEVNPSTYFAVEQELIDFNNIEYLWAKDSTGKKYKRYLHHLVKRIYKRLKLAKRKTINHV